MVQLERRHLVADWRVGTGAGLMSVAPHLSDLCVTPRAIKPCLLRPVGEYMAGSTLPAGGLAIAFDGAVCDRRAMANCDSVQCAVRDRARRGEPGTA